MHKHFKLYKPYGYLSQFITNQKKRRNKKLLGELYNFPPATMAIGRLDEDSEGLLLLTTDGKVSAEISGSGVEKEYYVQVDGEITPEAVSQMRIGVEIGVNGKKYLTKLTEGKFRQVKKMTAAVGFPTLRLVRVRIGNEVLKNMNVGEVQEVPRFNI